MLDGSFMERKDEQRWDCCERCVYPLRWIGEDEMDAWRLCCLALLRATGWGCARLDGSCPDSHLDPHLRPGLGSS